MCQLISSQLYEMGDLTSSVCTEHGQKVESCTFWKDVQEIYSLTADFEVLPTSVERRHSA